MTDLRKGEKQTVSAFVAGQATVHHQRAILAQTTRALRKVGRRIALVPTMGALHEGHLQLVRAAQQQPGVIVVVSIFVNPLQFAPGEDFDAYPRTLEADTSKLRAAGVDLVFAPSPAEMYPNGFRSTVAPGPLGSELEGATRPTHFAGALTVVNKLLNIVQPTDVYFGEKDYQQLVLMQQMVTDLDLPVAVHGVPIVREREGLALSSRNRYLSEAERESALALSAALVAGAHAAARGGAAVVAAARAVLASRPEVEVDYLELRGVGLGPAPETGDARLLLAARVGATRLIDNAPVELGPVEVGPVELGGGE